MSTAREELLAIIKALKQHVVAGEAWLEQEVTEVEHKLNEAFMAVFKPLQDVLRPPKRSTVDPLAAALKVADAEVAAKRDAAAVHAAGHGLDIADPLKDMPDTPPIRETVTISKADVGTVSAAAFGDGGEAGPSNPLELPPAASTETLS